MSEDMQLSTSYALSFCVASPSDTTSDSIVFLCGWGHAIMYVGQTSWSIHPQMGIPIVHILAVVNSLSWIQWSLCKKYKVKLPTIFYKNKNM